MLVALGTLDLDPQEHTGRRTSQGLGLEISRILLGHKSVIATQLYAEADKVAAMEIVGKVG